MEPKDSDTNQQPDSIEDKAVEMMGNDENIDSHEMMDHAIIEKNDDTTNNMKDEIYDPRLDMILTCCVPGCNERFAYFDGYKFRWKDERQKHFWQKALGKDKFGAPWRPTKFDRICKFHFIGNKPSSSCNMINYIPTKVRVPANDLGMSKKKPLYKKFRMSYCWYNGWSITDERGDDFRKMSKLLKSCWEQSFKDCQVICKDGVIYCHSIILAMSSPVFKQLLLPQEVEETKVIMLPDFAVVTVESFVQHCYCLDTGFKMGYDWKEVQNLMSILQVKGAVLHCEGKKSNRLAIKRAKTEMKVKPTPRLEFETSTEPQIILVSHLNAAKCCPDDSAKSSPVIPKGLDLKDCHRFVEQEIVAHPTWITEKSEKHGYVLDEDGKPSYQQISSSITFKTQQVVVENTVNENKKEKPCLVKLEPEIHINDATDDMVETPPQLKMQEPPKEPFDLKIKKSSNDKDPCSFDCATCDGKIKTTITQHNLLVSKINREMRAGRQKPIGVLYQCLKCQQSGIKPSREDQKKSWGFIEADKKEKKADKKDAVLCSLCGIECKNVEFLVWHMNVHEGIKPFKCDDCDKSFPHPHSLRSHRSQVHSIHKGKCSMCPEILKPSEGESIKEALQAHIMIHHSKDMPVKCTKCSFGSNSREEIEQHFSRCHSSECIQCDKCPAMVSRLSMKQHQLKHHDPKVPFECDQCQFRAITQTGIIHHQGRYHTTKRWSCGNGCGKTFSKVMTMRWHMKRFCSKSTVKEDMKKHEDLTGISQRKALRAAKNKEKLTKQYQEITGSGFKY